MKYLKLFLIALLISGVSFDAVLSAQVVVEEESNNDKASIIPLSMANARQMFIDRNVRGALNEYRRVLEADPKHAQATYRIGECHYALNNYDLAEKYLTEAQKLDPEVNKELHYWLGMTFHRLAKLDEAIEHFKTFRASSNRANNYYYEVDTYIEQCQFARMMMKHERDVTIKNMGRQINTRFDDYTPSVTADGKQLFFTSRRPDVKGGGIDRSGDYKYYENIFVSEWDEGSQIWSAASQVPGDLNTTAYDAVLSVAPDGKSMYVYKNNASSAGDINFATFIDSTQQWSSAEKLGRPINTSWFESSVSITADGQRLYFISERPGGEGQGDIYVSEMRGNGKWGKPENLGELVNTPGDEKFVFVHPNGKYLFFASNGHQTLGSYDIFRCELEDGKPTRPINLGYPINTVNEESTFSLTDDNQTMFIAAEYESSLGARDIFQIDLSNYRILDDALVAEVYLQGTITDNSNDRSLRDVTVGIYDKNDKLLFETQTDKRGEFEFKVLRGAVYELRTHVEGYSDFSEEIDLVDIDDTRLVVRKTIALD